MPSRTLLSFMFALGAIACGTERDVPPVHRAGGGDGAVVGDDSSAWRKLDITRVETRDLDNLDVRPGPQLRLVVRRREDLADAWQYVVGRARGPRAPEVDFTRYDLVIAATGTSGGGDAHIEIGGAYHRRAIVRVVVVDRETCRATDASSRGIAAALIPKQPATITFADSLVSDDCG